MTSPSPAPRSGFSLWTRLRIDAHGWPRLPWQRAWRSDLSAYADNELSPSERMRVEARLDASPEEREWLNEIERVHKALAVLPPAELPRSFELSEAQFEAARSADVQPISAAAASARAIPLRLATAGVVASWVALLTVGGYDMLDRPAASATLPAAESIAAAVTTGSADAQSAAQVAAPVAADRDQAALTEADQATETTAQSTVAAASPQASQSQEPEPPSAAAQAVAEEPDPEPDAPAAAAQTAAAPQAETAEQAAPAEDTPPAITAEQQEAARDPARSAVTAGISSNRDQSDAAGAGDQAAQADQPTAADNTDEAETTAAAAADEVQAEAAEPPSAPQAQAAAAETEPADESDAAVPTAAAADETRPTRAVVVSTNSAAAAHRVEIPDAGQHNVHRNPRHSADPNGYPIPARPNAGGGISSAEPSWETPVQIVLALIAGCALLLWLFCWIMSRRRTI